MTVPTVNVTVNVCEQDGTALPGATVSAVLTKRDRYGTTYVSILEVDGVTDGTGQVVLALFPNALGDLGSLTRFKCRHPTTNKKIIDTAVSIPNQNINLASIDPTLVTEEIDVVVEAAAAAAVSAAAAASSATSAAASAVSAAASASAASTNFLTKGNNLSDLASASIARTNLGLGTAAVAALTSLLLVANNLSDVANAGTARTNLGLGSLATLNAASLTANVSGILPTANGGTGIAFFAAAGPTVARTFTFPDANATIARTDAAQTFTGAQTFSSTIVGSINGNAATVTTNANLTGDVTSAGNATTIANSVVTYAKMQNVSATSRFLGRITAGAGVAEELTAANAKTILAYTLASADFSNQGTTTTVLHGNASGNPSWAAIGLTTDVSGTLPVGNGGTGVTSSSGTGSVALTNGATFVAPLLGTPASGVLDNCTTATKAALDNSTSLASTAYVDAATSILSQNSKSANYTTVLADRGKHIYHPVGDNNARTFTIDSNANVAYPTGTTITFVNEINTVTIAITTDTLVLAGTGSTGSRTLAANGQATALKVTSTRWVIAGTGLT